MRANRKNTKPSLLRRVVACLVSAAMVVAFTPVVAWGDETSVTVGSLTISATNGSDSLTEGTDYAYDTSSKTLTIKSGKAITISGNSTEVQEHIVVSTGSSVTAKVTLDNVKIVFGNGTSNDCAFNIISGSKVNLTLVGENILTSNGEYAGLQVPQGSELTITGGSTDSLSATGSNNGAGIGGGYNGAGGSIEINGGRVKAIGGLGAGIGGGGGAAQGGSVRISGGTVEAKGATGIGGGYSGGNGGDVTVSGGTVTATSIGNGAGIGGGYGNINGGNGGSGGNGGDVTITGGTVTAIGESGSAGIGGGYGGWGGNGGSGGSVTITGGTVIATAHSAGTPCGAGIGGGNGGGSIGGNGSKGADGTFKTNDGTNNGNAVVLASSIGDQSNKGNWSGVIFEKNDGKVYGSSVTPTENFEIPSNSKLTVPEGSTLTISGITAENKGSVYVDGTLSGLDGDLYYPLTVTGGSADKTYAYNEKTYGKVGEVVTLTRTSAPSEGYSAAWVADPSVDFNDGGFIMPAYALSITASETINKYTIAFDSNGGSDVASITKEYGAEVTAPANPTRSGYTFAGWYSDKALTQAYTFGTMPAEDITLYAKWNAVYVPPSDPSYNVPAEGEGGVAVRVTVSGSTAVVAEISALALVSAAGSGAESITIDLSGLPKGVTQAQLSKTTVDKLLAVLNDKDNAVESVTVNLGGAVLTLDAKALAAVAWQTEGANVTLGVKEGSADSLNSAQQNALLPFEVVQLYFTAEIKSGGVEIHDFGGGSVRVSVALAPKPGHNPARYMVLYAGEDGAIERYATAWAGGMLSFMAPHFSTYAVVYVEDEAQAAIDALTALPDAGKLKTSQAKEAVKKAKAALAQVAALDDGQKMLVDEALVANAQDVVKRGNELVATADKKAVGKVKNKAFSVRYGKSKSIAFKTKVSAAGTKVVYKKTKGSKYISVTKSGKVTAKKGMKAGKIYTAKVKATCGKAYKTVAITVRAK